MARLLSMLNIYDLIRTWHPFQQKLVYFSTRPISNFNVDNHQTSIRHRRDAHPRRQSNLPRFPLSKRGGGSCCFRAAPDSRSGRRYSRSVDLRRRAPFSALSHSPAAALTLHVERRPRRRLDTTGDVTSPVLSTPPPDKCRLEGVQGASPPVREGATGIGAEAPARVRAGEQVGGVARPGGPLEDQERGQDSARARRGGNEEGPRGTGAREEDVPVRPAERGAGRAGPRPRYDPAELLGEEAAGAVLREGACQVDPPRAGDDIPAPRQALRPGAQDIRPRRGAGKQAVNVPSFMVRVENEQHIDMSLASPFGGGRLGRVRRRSAYSCQYLLPRSLRFAGRRRAATTGTKRSESAEDAATADLTDSVLSGREARYLFGRTSSETSLRVGIASKVSTSSR